MRPPCPTLVLALLAAGCAHGPPTPGAPEVEALTIEGMKALDRAELADRIVTTESSWWPWWVPLLGRTGWFDPGAWQADLRRITRFYEAHGYYQARVLEDEVLPAGEGRVRLRVRLEEGLPSRVASLSVDGLDGLSPEHRAAVLADLPVTPGDVFLEERWGRAKRLLGERLRELGYATALVEAEALVDPDQARVEATLTATPGTRFRLGRVFVATDSGARVPARLVADVASPDLKAGDWYSESALLAAQARVFQMGVFAGVKVNRGAPDPGSGTVPVVIDVREAPFRSARVGFGLGGDLYRQELRLVGEYTNRDLGLSGVFLKDARLDRLTLKGKVGWTFLPTAWDVAAGSPASKTGPTARVLAEYEVPRVLGLRTVSFQGSVELSRMLDAAFDYLGGEAKLGLIWRPVPAVSVFPSVNVAAYLLNSQVSVRDNVPIAALGCPLGAPCVLSFVDLNLEWDRRDAPLEPREGFYLGLSVQGGLYQTTALKPYVRVVPEVRGYLSFGEQKRVTLAGKLKAGTLMSTDQDTPVVARFFSGGSNMRGFNTRRLAPQVAVPKAVLASFDYDDGETLPVGGNGLLEASLELRWNVWGELVLSVFTDWGLVTLAPLGPKTDLGRQLYAAVGLGARYRTPLGPIRLDLGFRLPFIGGPLELQTGEVRGFRSSPGCFFGAGAPAPVPLPTALDYAGSPDNACTFHLSIGEAF